MTNPAESLVDLLDLEQIEVNIFRGRSPQESLQRVFGGQVAGPGAGRRRPHHGRATGRCTRCTRTSCARAGPGVPIVYQVERVRDGRSFTTRRVTAVQQGRTIFNLTASFHQPEEGSFEHQLPPAREVPDPESLPTVADEIREHLGALPEALERMARRQPFDIRYVDRLRWTPEEIKDAEPRSAVWMRAVGPLGDDPLVHTCALTYASDMTLLDAVRIPVEPLWGPRGFDMASLDHAMWFHRPFRADEWFLYDQESPIAHGRPGAGPRPDLRPRGPAARLRGAGGAVPQGGLACGLTDLGSLAPVGQRVSAVRHRRTAAAACSPSPGRCSMRRRVRQHNDNCARGGVRQPSVFSGPLPGTWCRQRRAVRRRGRRRVSRSASAHAPPCSPPSLRAQRAQRRPDFLPVPCVPATDLATTADRPARRALRAGAPGRSPRMRRPTRRRTSGCDPHRVAMVVDVTTRLTPRR